MYLTRMKLDISKRKTMLALSTPSVFHGAVESSFTGERGRNLWRIDQLGGNYYLLILSENEPDLTEAQNQFGSDEVKWESKDYTALTDRVKEGTVWQFRLVANPTYSVTREGQKRGSVRAHTTPEHQMEWLIKESQKHGFQLLENSYSVASSQWYHFSKGLKGKRISMLAVSYEGILEVKDAAEFRETLLSGIGREKAYGMGLMTLVQYRGA